MNLIRLQHDQHPRPPHHELRQKRVLDSGYQSIGQVENLYVDEDMELHFVDVTTSGFMGLGTTACHPRALRPQLGSSALKTARTSENAQHANLGEPCQGDVRRI